MNYSTDGMGLDEPTVDTTSSVRSGPTQGGVPDKGHRGALGDFGGDAGGALIERTFRERIVLVGVVGPDESADDVEVSLDELAQLIDTAGADEVARVVQRRDRPDPATYVGKGKVSEIHDVAQAEDCDTVVFDNDLSPAQQYNLEKQLGRTALDRTAVILDIFAQNAASVEGKAQVELAQLRYLLPRLRGKKDFSQQGGGIGTRGPGETQLEVDRRRIERRLHKLEAKLRNIDKNRNTQRKARKRSPYEKVAIVGYTNAGKSTLLNSLTDAGVLAEDRLFATLDATTRKLALPGGEQVLLTDTVGFVRKLPHQLVKAFHSTLRVAADADLLIHVVDGSAHDPMGQYLAVREVLREIDAHELPELIVFNKLDLAPDAKALVNRQAGSVGISAHTGEGVEAMLLALGDRIRSMRVVYDIEVPWERGEVMASVHREGQVLTEAPGERGMVYRVRLDDAGASRLADFIVAAST